MHALEGVLLLLLLLLEKQCKCEYVIEFNENFKTCKHMKDKPFFINASDVQMFLDSNDNLVLSGNMLVVKDLTSPIGFFFYTEKMEQGNWIPAPISRRVLNLCNLMQKKDEPWYLITKNFKKKNCPYKQGHVESLNSIELGTLGFENILSKFSGEWRIYIEMTIGRFPKLDTSCMMVEASVLEY